MSSTGGEETPGDRLRVSSDTERHQHKSESFSEEDFGRNVKTLHARNQNKRKKSVGVKAGMSTAIQCKIVATSGTAARS